MQMVVTGLSAPLMDKAGRRPILMVAISGMIVMSALLASYYLVQTDCHTIGNAKICDSHPLPDPVAVFALYGYVFFFACGLGAIPWFIMGEIFPAEIKGIASSIATGVNWSLSFLITKTITKEADLMGGLPKGNGGVFASYCAICT